MSKILQSADTRTDFESGEISADRIRALIESFHSRSGMRRLEARRTLLEIGTLAIPALIEALEDPRWRVRWEAAKTLEEIGDPAATPALLKALEDSNPDVRWLAAEGLVAIGESALVPLLRELLERPESMLLREGAHHVVRRMMRRGLKEVLSPVRAALDSPNPRSEVPLAAEEALIALTGVAPRISRSRPA